MNDSFATVSKVWNCAHILMIVGVNYSNYVEAELDRQITRANRSLHPNFTGNSENVWKILML